MPDTPAEAPPSSLPARPRVPAGSIVPIFPLPNGFLYPHLFLPLHIFEPRYKTMVADALVGERLLGVSLITGGTFEAPEPNTICGVGVIEDSEELAEGKKNILVRGLTLVMIDEIVERDPYIKARVTPLQEDPGASEDLETMGGELRRLLAEIVFLRDDLSDEMLTRIGMMTHPGIVADFVALYFIEDLSIKQEIMETLSVPGRAQRVKEIMRKYLDALMATRSSEAT